jgi:hypothetical protein
MGCNTEREREREGEGDENLSVLSLERLLLE